VFEVGDTVIEAPEPAEVPPHEPVNHCAVAPVPAEPPLRVKVVLEPLQMVLEPVMLVGAVLKEFTVTNCEAQAVVLQVPSYRTKYVVFEEGETEMEAPEPASVPPQDPVYHVAAAAVPAEPPDNVKVVLEPLQMVVVPVILVGAVLNVFTVTVVEAHVVVLQVPSYRTK
jgi:hypothetical protein